jgi:UDP-2,4-diacetamido-2,4,6-trideoxy-beta-L-altropyranose hydrolase
MVIDDLANRKHCCEVLLDQTCNRDPKDYVSLVSEATNLLVGAQYMLIRPEFVEWRQISLSRRRSSGIKQLLISMGGVDAQNITGKVLHLLKQGFLPPDIKIIVVLGPTSPWLTAVQEEIQRLKNPVEIVVNPKNMAEIMANSDLAIGAAGTSAWERCCLGLPSIIIILAENQRENALALEKAVAAIPIYIEEIYKIKDAFNVAQKQLLYMSKAAASITDGKGTTNVINYLIQRFPQRFSNGSLS